MFVTSRSKMLAAVVVFLGVVGPGYLTNAQSALACEERTAG